MPDIKWIGSPNFYQGREGHQVIAIVDHIMCGTEGGTDSWFQNPKSQVSAHYGVAKDGTIHQYVKDEDTAWAVGIVNRPTWALIRQTNNHPNTWTLSIEHEGQPGDTMPEAQYQATLWLHLQLVKKFSIPADSVHIIGHCEIDSVNRKYCPGPHFPLGRLLADLRAAQNPLPADIASGYEGFVSDVQWAYSNGLIGHYADGLVKPQEWLSREQFAFALHQFAQKIVKGELR